MSVVYIGAKETVRHEDQAVCALFWCADDFQRNWLLFDEHHPGS